MSMGRAQKNEGCGRDCPQPSMPLGPEGLARLKAPQGHPTRIQ